MQRITLEIAEPSDLELLLLLAKRMGIKVLATPSEEMHEEEVAYHKAIVAEGGAGTPNIKDPMQWQRDIREDRNLPFRD